MRSIIRFVFIILLLNQLDSALAQKSPLVNETLDTAINYKEYNRWSVYGYAGLSQFYGDIVPVYQYSPIMSYNGILSKDLFFGVSRQLTKLFSIDGRFEMANLTSYRFKSSLGTAQDSLKFNTDLFHYEVSTTFSFSNWFWPNVKNRKWNSYLLLGAGFTHFRAVSYSLNQNIKNKVSEYYGYDKIDDYNVKNASRKVVPSATIGIGVKYRISKRFDVGLELVQTSVYNDQLDAYARVLSERDKYGHLSVGLVYHIGRKDKNLVWDFPSEYTLLSNRINLQVQNSLCECPKINENFRMLDTLVKVVNQVKAKSDSAVDPKMVVIKGTIVDENKEPLEAQVDVVEKVNNDTIAAFETNSETGKYVISIPAGKEYIFAIKSKGYSPYTEDMVIPDTSTSKELDKGVTLIKLKAGRKIVLKNIYYDFDKATLRPESNVELMNLLDLLKSNPTIKIEISGHTDNIGSANYNKKLSQSRAKSVVDFLVKKGIKKSRLKSAGYGFTQPFTPTKSDGARQLNRRTEIRILSN